LRQLLAIVDSRGRLAGHAPGFLRSAGALVADSSRITELRDAAARAYQEKRNRLSMAWRTGRAG
jgi:hypothetical protein